MKMPPKNTKYNTEYLQTHNFTAEVYFLLCIFLHIHLQKGAPYDLQSF